MLAKAREVCSFDPLTIPFMGAGLSRVAIKESVMLDLIIAAICEESNMGRITKDITIILPIEKKWKVNLKNHVRNWSNG